MGDGDGSAEDREMVPGTAWSPETTFRERMVLGTAWLGRDGRRLLLDHWPGGGWLSRTVQTMAVSLACISKKMLHRDTVKNGRKQKPSGSAQIHKVKDEGAFVRSCR